MNFLEDALLELCKDLEARNVPYFMLFKGYATSKNIKDAVIVNPYTKMWFHTGTGTHLGDPFFDPFLDLANGMMFAYLAKSYTSQGYTVPPDYVYLPSYIENGSNEFGIQLVNSGKIKIGFLDDCFSNDKNYWAWALGAYSDLNVNHHDQVMIGWKVASFGGYKYPDFLQQFFYCFVGDAADLTTVQQSIEYARTHSSDGTAIYENNFIFGLNPKWWFGYGLPTEIKFHNQVEE